MPQHYKGMNSVTWMNLRNVMSSEIKQTRKGTHEMALLT